MNYLTAPASTRPSAEGAVVAHTVSIQIPHAVALAVAAASPLVLDAVTMTIGAVGLIALAVGTVRLEAGGLPIIGLSMVAVTHPSGPHSGHT